MPTFTYFDAKLLIIKIRRWIIMRILKKIENSHTYANLRIRKSRYM